MSRSTRATTPVAALLALAALMVSPASSLAWGPLGHRSVGAVADALLSPAAHAEVARLLADDRDRDGRPSGRTTLAEVSLWADEIRGTQSDRPAWHYDNMPVCGLAPPQATWCPEAQCASGRIEGLLAQLADRTAPPAKRRDALKWIAHLVGDLHQPLHAADYAQGGNQVHVEFAGRPAATPWTLHAAWDIRLVSSALHAWAGHAGASQIPPEASLRSLIARARRLPPAAREAPVAQWRAESNRLAREVALDYPGFRCDGVGADPIVLSADYQRRAQRVIVSQLALAGARLATVLDRALAPGQARPRADALP
jgi:hypothetical protein